MDKENILLKQTLYFKTVQIKIISPPNRINHVVWIQLDLQYNKNDLKNNLCEHRWANGMKYKR